MSIDLTAAIEAVSQVLCGVEDTPPCKLCVDEAGETVAFAAPLIEAAVRKQVADEIDAWLEAEHSPPIWMHAVDIADPNFCDRHPEDES